MLPSRHLEEYLSSFEDIEVERFDSFVVCKDAKSSQFDLLYIHYDEINKEELQRIVARHGLESQIVLVTKLIRRNLILDISPIFSQILYEPITYSKVKNSLILASDNYNHSKRDSTPLFNGLHALIIEDNRVNQKVIAKTLKEMGVSSDIAKNGQEGVECYTQNRYDIVFMDIQMPVMNGVVATKRMLEYEKQKNIPHTPIVAVTTNALKGDRERYLQAGMDEYIPKPIDTNKLVAVLKQFYLSTEESGEVSKRDDADILLFKESLTEGKIIATILKKLSYSVDLVKNSEEFFYQIKRQRYKLLLLDRVGSDESHEEITRKLYSVSSPTLLMIGDEVELKLLDIETYTHVVNKSADFNTLKEKIEMLIAPSNPVCV